MLSAALFELGFTQSKHDPCLLFCPGMFAVFCVDDAGIAAQNKAKVDQLIADLRTKGFELTQEGTFSEFLGIKFTNNANGSITMTQ